MNGQTGSPKPWLRRLWAWGSLALACWVASCAQGTIPAAEAPCAIDADCSPLGRCNPVTGLCIQTSTPDMRDDSGHDTRDDSVHALDARQDLSAQDARGDLMTPDDGSRCEPACGPSSRCVMGVCSPLEPAACSPPCPATHECQEGQCLPKVCDPPCQAPGTCTAQGCEYPACSQDGQPCDGRLRDQDRHWCLTLGQDPQARCASKCSILQSHEGCPYGRSCEAPLVGQPQLRACVPSLCQGDADCAQRQPPGTCVTLGHGFSACEDSGPLAPGQACALSDPARRCQQGTTCLRGLCRRLCDPWARTSSCGAGQRCNVLGPRQGVCLENPDAMGLNTYDPCAMAGSYCADAVECVQGAASAFCFKHCRADASGQSTDCSGLAISGSVCHTYLRPGQRDSGLCQPGCVRDAECGDVSRRACVQGRCRRRCLPERVAQDCCSGSSPCAWSCVSGLCE